MYLFDLFYILTMILIFPFHFKTIINKKKRQYIRDRFVPGLSSSEEKRIWIHAVSVGEVKGLESFIKELRKKFQAKIVLSVTTRSGLKIASKIFPGLDIIGSPFDFSFTVKKFVRTINPMILILNELEIWPNWMSIMEKEKIPVLLINGRISDNAYSRYRKFSLFLKPVFRKLTKVLIQGDWYKSRFIRMGVPPDRIISCGNIKADEAVTAAGNLPSIKEIIKESGLDNKREIILFASSHREDEKLFIPVLKDLLDRFSIIIAPRHVERSETLKRTLLDTGIDTYLFSETDKSKPDRKVMIFNRMGYLMHLMKLSSVIFMGGGMDPSIGGHNLYEPAILGKPIIGGSFFNNFPDIGAALIKTGVYRIVEKREDIQTAVEASLAGNIDNICNNGQKAVKSGQGAVNCIIGELEAYLN